MTTTKRCQQIQENWNWAQNGEIGNDFSFKKLSSSNNMVDKS